MRLGLMIEKINGLSYFSYNRQHIFTPTGMTVTDTYIRVRAQPKLPGMFTNCNTLTNKIGLERNEIIEDLLLAKVI